MARPAAFEACYSDLRLVRGRKVAVVHLEIPIERATEFVAAFGMPDPAEEKWVAIARLNAGSETPVETKERKRLSELRPSAQAALMGSQPKFWAFLNEHPNTKVRVETEDEAATAVRKLCGVNTRSAFDKPGEASERWRELRDAYTAWNVVA